MLAAPTTQGWTFALALLLAATSDLAQESRPLEEIVWMDEAHTKPTLVPASTLDRYDWLSPALPVGTPLSQRQAETLREAIRWRLSTAKARAHQPCALLGVADSVSATEGKQTLAEFVASAPIAAVARVDRLVPGWSDSWQSVASQVRLTVEEILVDSEGRLRESQTISFVLLQGDFSLGGARFCRDPEPGSLFLRPGDLVVVAGYRDRANAGGLHPIGFFAVSGGKILSERHFSLQRHEPQSLSDLRRELAENRNRSKEK